VTQIPQFDNSHKPDSLCFRGFSRETKRRRVKNRDHGEMRENFCDAKRKDHEVKETLGIKPGKNKKPTTKQRRSR